MDVIAWLHGRVHDAIAALQAAGRLPAGFDPVPIEIQAPEQPGRGDFACNAALVLGRPAAMPARTVANLLADRLAAVDGLANVAVAGPGFLNVTLAPTIWAQMLAGLLAAGADYGAGARGEARQVDIGFVPIDPRDPRPVSPARREAVGTALANMLGCVAPRAKAIVGPREAGADIVVRLGPILGVGERGAGPFPGHRGGDLDLRTIADLIGPDAARLGLLMQPADAPLDLDLDLLADQSHANAVFHLHYAHARCCALRRRGEEVIDEAQGGTDWDISAFEDEGARLILRLLALYPSQIDLAARQREPWRLLQYLRDLADGLHRQYYRSLSAPNLRFIRDDDRLLTGARLALVRGVETVLKSGLGLLGSSAPDELR